MAKNIDSLKSKAGELQKEIEKLERRISPVLTGLVL